MTADQFLQTLPVNPSAALEEIDSTLAWDGKGYTMPPEDREMLVRHRARLAAEIAKRGRGWQSIGEVASRLAEKATGGGKAFEANGKSGTIERPGERANAQPGLTDATTCEGDRQ